MSATITFPVRNPCPPGACVCELEAMLDDPSADLRVLRLTREEEKKLLLRLESLQSYQELVRMQQRMHEQLGIAVTITPSERGVRTVRGINIQIQDQRGLCKKTRQTIPAAIRKCLEKNEAIAFAIVDAHGLLAPTQAQLQSPDPASADLPHDPL
ncbi:hypothetical protein [Oxalicibacterium faecigallinarum]|nr:hypothetical protein [Oxalicibacterium faecigallinarum]